MKATETQTTLVDLKLNRFEGGSWRRISDTVAKEVAVDIRWEDAARGYSGTTTLWAWPHELEELALGHTLLELDRQNDAPLLPVANVVAESPFSFVVSIGQKTRHIPPPPENWNAASLVAAMRTFIAAPGLWEETGCFHRAGAFSIGEEKLLYLVEDIGRHNCLDRLAGWSASSGTPLADKALLTSARITASYCAKALRAGFRILVSRGTVTSAAIALAREETATLVGFARPNEERFTVFADDPRRLVVTEGGDRG